MVRRTSNEDGIGARIRDRRIGLRLSQRKAAALADISHTTWSRIERGELSADNRFVLAGIARALRCEVTFLSQHSDGLGGDSYDAAGSGAVYETMRAVVEADLRYPSENPAPPLSALERELDLVTALRAKCDYRGAAQRLPDLLRGLHAAVCGADRAAALRALTIAQDTASFVVRYAGYPTDACQAAERAQQSAEALEHPVMLGLAAWSRAHGATGCGLYDRARVIAQQAAQSLEPHVGLPDAPEMLGQLLMTQAFAAYALGRVDEAGGLVGEAQRIAARTGDTDVLHLMFGPTNIDFWRIAMAADGDSPGEAVDIARATNPSAVPNIARQAAFYIDTGRALARVGKDREALRMLLTAERIAPQRLHDDLVKETVRGLRERARRRYGWTELRGLAQRVGLGT